MDRVREGCWRDDTDSRPWLLFTTSVVARTTREKQKFINLEQP
jgi:hypothetical protein